jgi:hypothetical protein
MSLTALRQAAFSARRTYTVGSSVEIKRPDGGDSSRSERGRIDTDVDGVAVPLEPHWQASIDAATD